MESKKMRGALVKSVETEISKTGENNYEIIFYPLALALVPPRPRQVQIWPKLVFPRNGKLGVLRPSPMISAGARPSRKSRVMIRMGSSM